MQSTSLTARDIRLSPHQALSQLAQTSGEFALLFRHGSLELEVYRPRGTDRQQPHDRDEVYIIIAGTGRFFFRGEYTPFAPGDFLFVPAGVEHRFEDFSDDFATWVIFYGPRGGEGQLQGRQNSA